MVDSLEIFGSVELIFGEESQRVDRLVESGVKMVPQVDGIDSFSLDASYSIAILVLILLYLFWCIRSLQNLKTTQLRINNPISLSRYKSGGVGSIRLGDTILNWTLVVAMLTLVVTKSLDILQYYMNSFTDLTDRIVEFGIWLWMAYVAVAFMAIIIWSGMMTSLLGYLFRNEWLSGSINEIKSNTLRSAVVWLLPIALLSALDMRPFVVSYVSVVVGGVFLAIYLFRTFSLFVAQKISILLWFLYLCAVEIFPVTFLWRVFLGR